MRKITYIAFIIVFFSNCTKEKAKIIEPYSKRVIYFESFDNSSSWVLLPTDTVFTPDSTCVRFENGLLKMIFDQQQNNCGCAWVGAELNQITPLETSYLDKIGIRIKLNEGYFQAITRYHDTVDVWGHPVQTGESVTFSTLRLDFNCLTIAFPNPFNGKIHRDSTLDLNLNKLVGTEFEVIYDNGTKSFYIDGIEQNTNMIYFNWQNMINQPLNFTFQLGHLPELSSNIDQLYIEEIEIFTWSGNK